MHLQVKWRAWLNAPGTAILPSRLRLKPVCVCWHGGRGTGSVRSASQRSEAPGTGHFPPSQTHALVTNPRLGQTRDRCTRWLFSGEVVGVQGANVGSRETTASAAVGPQCWAMRGVSVIGSQLKSTKLPVSHVPVDSLPRPPRSPDMWLMLMVTGIAPAAASTYNVCNVRQKTEHHTRNIQGFPKESNRQQKIDRFEVSRWPDSWVQCGPWVGQTWGQHNY